jgi:hypothetical protein
MNWVVKVAVGSVAFQAMCSGVTSSSSSLVKAVL